MTVTLTNTSRRLKVVTLTHTTYCEVCGECSCTITPGRTPRRLAASITLLGGNTSAELDDAVLHLPDVMRAVRAGELRVAHVPHPADGRRSLPTRGDT